jgi:anti-sigma factor RsiW
VNCKDCRERAGAVADQEVDGPLDPAELRAIEEHLAGCAECARLHAETAELQRGLRGLPPVEGNPAPMWTRIEAELDSRVRQVAWYRRPWLIVPALSAAALAALLVVRASRQAGNDALTAQLLDDAQAEFRRGEEHYRRAIFDLREVAEHERAAWTPDRQKHFDESLAGLDAAVDRWRAQALARPGDPEAEELLLGACQKEVAFLEEAAFRGAAQ